MNSSAGTESGDGDEADSAGDGPGSEGGKKTFSDGTSNPMEGEPGSCNTCNNSKGNKNQERTYAADGWPQTDIDYDHNHLDANGKKVGQPHAHDWGRPADGSRPRAPDRSPARPLRPGEGN